MKPRAAPGLLSQLTALVPARIVKKLDNAPRSADAWNWQEHTVTSDSGERVTLTPKDGVVSDIADVKCSCLLSPRCFHVLAVVATLETAEPGEAAAPIEPATSELALPDARVSVDADQRAIAERARVVLGDWLLIGTSGAGAVLQGELLRVVHEARISGAHRLAGAALRVVRNTRALRGAKADFESRELLTDLLELGATARQLATQSEVAHSVVGTARREYSPIGSLRLFGVGCEPVIARSGYAGVVSYVCDERGRFFTLNDVLPADGSRALGTYDVALAMGDTSITHRELTRAGLFVQDAAASDDGRLSAGRQVKAVRASGTAPRFQDGPLAQLFETPFESQLERAFAAFETNGEPVARSASLVFVQAEVVGSANGDLLVTVEDKPFCIVPSDDDPRLPYRENLRLLAELTGRTLHVIAHVSPERPRTLCAVTIQANEGALVLPPAFDARVNLGLDVLTRAQLVTPTRNPCEFEPPGALDPLSALRRRLLSLALHGQNSLPSEASVRVDAERAALRKAVMPAGADALGRLLQACLAARTRRQASLAYMADAFVAAASYERAATLYLRRQTF